MLDVGVSGGIVAADAGYAMMAGGDRSAFDHCRPLFEAMCQENGWGLVDERSGAGHFTKMVHNAIEYGMMQAIAEGFDLLERGSYEGLDLRETARIWNHGCIISSFLMQMVQSALDRDAKLSDLKPHVADSGEGRWAAFEAMERAVPFVANTYALQARHISRDDDSFAFRLLAAMRREFGGHTVKESPR
jgi:6-phosphogluconate dehydrogenase